MREGLEIEELVLRLPGLRPDDARWLAGAVLQRLAEELPSFRARTPIGRLDLRLRLPGPAPLADLPRLVVDELRRCLG
jgi:hypothetical protein